MGQIVFWHVKELAEEFHLLRWQVGRLLSSLGAKRWSSPSGSPAGTIWYWEG